MGLYLGGNNYQMNHWICLRFEYVLGGRIIHHFSGVIDPILYSLKVINYRIETIKTVIVTIWIMIVC